MSKITQVSAEEKSAARRLAETFSEETLDSLIKDAVKSGTPIDGADGLLNELTKAGGCQMVCVGLGIGRISGRDIRQGLGREAG